MIKYKPDYRSHPYLRFVPLIDERQYALLKHPVNDEQERRASVLVRNLARMMRRARWRYLGRRSMEST